MGFKINQMKKRQFLFILIVMIGTKLHAQSNLQFGKVKLVTLADTVPLGKIWKIESIIIPENCYNYYYRKILINNQTIIVSHTVFGSQFVSNTNGVALNEMMKLPAWLPEGTVLAAYQNCGIISLIEFNVVQ